jgi:LysR family transcriptional regulator, glycine cleavage system transcriptional activator
MQDRPLRSLSGLIDFDCAARWGSFTLAAQELHKTPAAISLQVKQLEEAVGFALFVRHPRHITLTDKGQDLAVTVAQMLRELRTKVDLLRGGHDEHVLRISTTHSFALKWLAPRLGQFTQLYPELDIRLDSSDRIVDIEREDIDLAIRHCVTRDHPAVLFEERMVVAYSPSLLGPGETELTLADLPRFPLLYEDTTEYWARLLQANGTLEGPYDFSRSFSHYGVLTQAAVAGQGIALVAYSIAHNDIQKGALRMMRAKSVHYPRGYCFVVAAHKAERPKIRRFREWLQGEMGAMQRALEATSRG